MPSSHSQAYLSRYLVANRFRAIGEEGQILRGEGEKIARVAEEAEIRVDQAQTVVTHPFVHLLVGHC
jgi:hypothetical protein